MESSAPPIPRWVVVVAAALALVVLVHSAATALWIAPRNPVSQAAAEPLGKVMDPMFQQSWSLFAPTPINVANSLEVRAFDADLNATEWVDVTDVEISANFTHQLFPNRASRPTRMLAARAHAQFIKLTDDERHALGGHYHHDAWPRLAEALEEADGSSSAARRRLVLAYDKTMAAYATEYVRATVTELDPVYVQFRVVRQRAAPYASRDEVPQAIAYTFGRRPMYEFSRQDSEAFREAIERFQQ
ncbi:DUF5819 family protein [Isoptericola sp. BMS4]|uniref:DUF5819 family protein n=1 Tax=Isoptericola sp. BMS4 TaxID=2527875 RepID=UPI00141EB257|nr:DUF5819 family protein [Isoptericola sp. BMS4]